MSNTPRHGSNDLSNRTLAFAVRIVNLCNKLRENPQTWVIAQQLAKSGTSIGANYRESQFASSKRHFITTLEVAQRETAETEYWLDIVTACEFVPAQRLENLRDECRQLRAILTSAILTAKRRKDTDD